MSDKSLSNDEITKLLRTDKQQQQPKWPTEADIITIAKAVKNEEEYVTLKDGQKYYIKYHTRWDSVFVRPAANGVFFPCGYFSLDKLRSVIKYGSVA